MDLDFQVYACFEKDGHLITGSGGRKVTKEERIVRKSEGVWNCPSVFALVGDSL
jgi:hypothetical protein